MHVQQQPTSGCSVGGQSRWQFSTCRFYCFLSTVETRATAGKQASSLITVEHQIQSSNLDLSVSIQCSTAMRLFGIPALALLAVPLIQAATPAADIYADFTTSSSFSLAGTITAISSTAIQGSTTSAAIAQAKSMCSAISDCIFAQAIGTLSPLDGRPAGPSRPLCVSECFRSSSMHFFVL